MARTTAPEKEPNRIVQMWRVYNMTRRYDPLITWYLIGSVVLLAGVGVLAGLLLSRESVLGLVLYIIAGVVGGVLVALIILGRRAERAAYGQIAGEPGAVGAVMKSGLRRTWTGTEMPVAMSPKTKDAVYRAVGRGGVVLVGEGPKSRTQRMLEEERRNVLRVAGTVPVHFLYVGPDADATPLYKLPSAMNRFKRALTTAEVTAVSSRLASLTRAMGGVGIPKGIDPTKVRAPRPR
jgi:hypothetical protein